eukprot:TRINITY_DN1638_c1_g1_i1.p1 TRINITY_DN1638_c1_g1~~TRINITY_DN1638_c1_g1_i1.p1  ORF type:complete len:641 (-),score=155.12 TRINITY_DN1638_c1_g1_i1:312-2234(-)
MVIISADDKSRRRRSAGAASGDARQVRKARISEEAAAVVDAAGPAPVSSSPSPASSSTSRPLLVNSLFDDSPGVIATLLAEGSKTATRAASASAAETSRGSARKAAKKGRLTLQLAAEPPIAITEAQLKALAAKATPAAAAAAAATSASAAAPPLPAESNAASAAAKGSSPAGRDTSPQSQSHSSPSEGCCSKDAAPSRSVVASSAEAAASRERRPSAAKEKAAEKSTPASSLPTATTTTAAASTEDSPATSAAPAVDGGSTRWQSHKEALEQYFDDANWAVVANNGFITITRRSDEDEDADVALPRSSSAPCGLVSALTTEATFNLADRRLLAGVRPLTPRERAASRSYAPSEAETITRKSTATGRNTPEQWPSPRAARQRMSSDAMSVGGSAPSSSAAARGPPQDLQWRSDGKHDALAAQSHEDERLEWLMRHAERSDARLRALELRVQELEIENARLRAERASATNFQRVNTPPVATSQRPPLSPMVSETDARCRGPVPPMPYMLPPGAMGAPNVAAVAVPMTWPPPPGTAYAGALPPGVMPHIPGPMAAPGVVPAGSPLRPVPPPPAAVDAGEREASSSSEEVRTESKSSQNQSQGPQSSSAAAAAPEQPELLTGQRPSGPSRPAAAGKKKDKKKR